MQRSVHIAVLAVCAAVCGNPAAAEPLEKARYEAALATARGYAADQTLINYCMRRAGDEGPYLYIWAHDNLQQAIQRLKMAGGDPRQVEGLTKVVTANTRFFAADAKDADLEPQCASKQVEQNAALMMGVGVPLILRPPFKDFPR